MTGSQTIDVLEQSVENVFTDDPAVKLGSKIQVGGLRFRYDPQMAKGQRARLVARTVGSWRPMDEYAVATNTMMARGKPQLPDAREEREVSRTRFAVWDDSTVDSQQRRGRHDSFRPNREGRHDY